MKTLEEMPATLLRQAGEESAEERSRAAREGQGWVDGPGAQLQDGLDVDVFHVGFLVEMIVRKL